MEKVGDVSVGVSGSHHAIPHIHPIVRIGYSTTKCMYVVYLTNAQDMYNDKPYNITDGPQDCP